MIGRIQPLDTEAMSKAKERQASLTNAFYVTPYLSTREEKPKKNVTVRIICGGGLGSPLIKRLMDEGYKVTAGVLNVLDTDYEIARSLGVSVIGEIPFSQITTNSFNANLDLIRDSNAVVLTNFPIGPGNLRNIEAAEAALDIDDELAEGRVEVEGDPVNLLCDEFLGISIVEYIGGKSALFNYVRYDMRKPGVISELGVFLDDVIAGLIAGCMTKLFEDW